MTEYLRTLSGVGRLEWNADEEIANYTLMIRELAPGCIDGHGTLTDIPSGRLGSACKANSQELVDDRGQRWPIVITLVAAREADFILNLASQTMM
ncbi:hypothetical protein [Hartmannibacter diazotrophicus]|uniref:hypothetical protein n=1 Tax=Hartmannibacter diazotrophicus TaxID=1482074 RepID=UPI000C150717|nr:hypothetical protein [Hartmannibacter diazotrophicus]